MKLKSSYIVRSGLIAAIYAVLTLILPVSSYGPIQFRFSEILTLLAFYNPSYIVGLTLGCLLGNLGSPFGIVDVLLGTLASYLALKCMTKVNSIYVASIFPAIFTPVIVAGVIKFFTENSPAYFIILGQLFISQFVVVSILGVTVFKILEKRTRVIDLIKKSV